MDVTVHNQCPDIELVSPVYFCNCGTCYEYPIERTDDGAMMKIGFRFGLLDKLPRGILMYEVQKKEYAESDYQSSTDATSIETVEDTPKMTLLLVAWEIERFEKPRVNIVLIGHDNELVLNEDKLAQLYDKINDQLSTRYDSFQSTWLLYDNTVLETTCVTVYEKGFELKITISEGDEDEDTESALWIDSERQVTFSGSNVLYVNSRY
jgi:hypothetical protein